MTRRKSKYSQLVAPHFRGAALDSRIQGSIVPCLFTAPVTAAKGERPSRIRVPSVEDTEVTATRLGPDTAPATVFYIHGLLAGSTYWSPLTRHLHTVVDGGIAQIVYDQRGCGSQASPQATQADLSILIEDLDAVLTQTSHGAIILVTHSTGALVAQAWARRYPRRAQLLSGVVFFNPWPDVTVLSGAAAASTWPAWQELRLLGELISHLYNPPLSCGHAHCHRIGSLGRRGDVLTPAVLASQEAALSEDVVDVLRGIPTWVVAGEADLLIKPELTQKLAERIWSEHVAIPGAGHSLPHTDPVRAAEPILTALDVVYRDQQHGGASW